MMQRIPGILLALLIAPAALADQDVDRRAPADPAGEVDVSNVAGTVSISGWDRSEVQVSGSLGEDVERLDFTSEAKRTVIKVVNKHDHGGWGGNGEAELNIRVPKGSHLDVNTVSAEINVAGVTGALRLQAVSGDVTSDMAREDVEVKTVSGNVQLRGTGDANVITLTTVSGDAQVRRAAGEIVGNTVSGTLNIELEKIARARLRTTSGDLELQGAVQPDARIDIETISGELSLNFKGQPDAEFEVESFSGDINNCFGPKPESKSKYGPGTELRFRQGNGSARIRLNSLSGDITFCSR